MKKYIALKFVFGFIMVLIFGCNSDNTVNNVLNNANGLDKMNWSARNHTLLNQLINNYGIGGKYYDAKKPSYVVLDWDQTCAFLDVEEAVMRYQLTNLKFKLTKNEFSNLLKNEINGITNLSSNFNNIKLADINEDLITDYNFLYENFVGLKGNKTLAEIKQTPYYFDFITKLAFLYDGYCGTSGIDAAYGYPWVIELLAGHSINEIKSLAKEVISYELANKLSKEEWITPDNFDTKAGKIKYSFKTGLRVLPEMQNLISTFERNGISVFVVSASFKPVVEAFSEVGNFGYNVPNDRIIAMELETKDGILLPKYKENWFKTQRYGKVEAINKIIKNDLKKNWDPIFSAVDSDGDYEMATMFPDMKLTLIWNRLKGGDIGKLCSQAVNEMDSSNPLYILQGRDENAGIAIPFSETIPYGKTTKQLLP